jgi:putative intracellular protease/amidase
MDKRALIVVTSNDKLGNTDQKTGWFLSEVSHVYWPLVNDGFSVTFVSPKGGEAPLEENSLKLDDPENKSFVERFKVKKSLSTKALSEVNAEDFGVIYFAGGHGTMWDFPNNPDIEKAVNAIYEKGGIVAAVCHGPSALTSIKTSDGEFLVNNKDINSFTDDEEREVKKDGIVPFLLESKLKERGAKFQKAPNWGNKVVVDGRLITGQNPQSASSLGKAIVTTYERLFSVTPIEQENREGQSPGAMG